MFINPFEDGEKRGLQKVSGSTVRKEISLLNGVAGKQGGDRKKEKKKKTHIRFLGMKGERAEPMKKMGHIRCKGRLQPY